MDATVIVFDDREKVLKAGVPPDRYRAYGEAIVKFRHWPPGNREITGC
jgi:hypothetical protein